MSVQWNHLVLKGQSSVSTQAVCAVRIIKSPFQFSADSQCTSRTLQSGSVQCRWPGSRPQRKHSNTLNKVMTLLLIQWKRSSLTFPSLRTGKRTSHRESNLQSHTKDENTQILNYESIASVTSSHRLRKRSRLIFTLFF